MKEKTKLTDSLVCLSNLVWSISERYDELMKVLEKEKDIEKISFIRKEARFLNSVISSVSLYRELQEYEKINKCL